MAQMNSSTMDDNSSSPSNAGISPSTRFWSYLCFNVASISCTLLVLYYLLTIKKLRQALHNHIIIVLLIIGLLYELTDIPWILHYNRTGVPMFQSPVFYIFWVFYDYAIYSTQIALFAWATIERHILIFHGKWVATRRKRFFVHYLPIITIITYDILYYAIIHFVPFCENSFDDFLAGGIFIPCLFSHTLLGSWDLIVHQVTPTLTIFIFSSLLILRVVWRKRRMNQPVTWRKHRKMTVQLLSIAAIYIVFNFPWTFLIFAFQYGLPESIVSVPLMYTAYLYYYIFFLFPFACCWSLPEIRRDIVQTLFWWRKTTRKESSLRLVVTRTAMDTID